MTPSKDEIVISVIHRPIVKTKAAIRSANTIRGKPTGDDMIYTVEKDGEVVAEVLASDAGIEPGYLDAYNARGEDTFESQSWMIDGATSRNLDTPPFGGQDGIILHALYPVVGGVAAMITDFNIGAAQAPVFGMPGILAVATPVAFAQGSEGDLVTAFTVNGREWSIGEIIDTFNAQFGDLAWAFDIDLWVLLIVDEEGVGVTTSNDGTTGWNNPDYTLDIELPGGNPVQVLVTGDQTFFVYSLPDSVYTQYRVEIQPDGNAFITQIFGPSVADLEPFDVLFARGRAEAAAREARSDDALDADSSFGTAGLFFPPRPTED